VETIQEILRQAEGTSEEESKERQEQQRKSDHSSTQEKERKTEESGITFLKVVSVLGAILVGVGVISLVAANWQEMTDTTKITLILLGIILAYSAGGYVRFYKDMVYSGDALLLLGNIIFGAGIFLIGQIYNLQVEWPDGFMLWTLGSLAMGMATRVYAILYMAILLLLPSAIGGVVLILGESTDAYLLTTKVLPVLLLIVVFGSIWWLREELPAEHKQTF